MEIYFVKTMCFLKCVWKFNGCCRSDVQFLYTNTKIQETNV